MTTDDDHDDDDSSSAVTDCPENDRAAVREFCYTRYSPYIPTVFSLSVCELYRFCVVSCDDGF